MASNNNNNVVVPVTSNGAVVNDVNVEPYYATLNADGSNFRDWRRRVLFFLTSLRLEWCLTETPPNTWDISHSVCKHQLLHLLSNELYFEYRETPTVKELWTSLNLRFAGDDQFNLP